MVGAAEADTYSPKNNTAVTDTMMASQSGMRWFRKMGRASMAAALASRSVTSSK